MFKYMIELIPSVEKNIIITPAEWLIIVMLTKYPDFNKMIVELKSRYNMNSDEIKQSLSNLQKKKMIKLLQTQEEAEQEEAETSDLFWETITKELSRAIGPIADIVIDDAVGEFNVSRDKFPAKYLYSLVEKVAAEIHTTAEKSQFQKAMLEFIKQSV